MVPPTGTRLTSRLLITLLLKTFYLKVGYLRLSIHNEYLLVRITSVLSSLVWISTFALGPYIQGCFVFTSIHLILIFSFLLLSIFVFASCLILFLLSSEMHLPCFHRQPLRPRWAFLQSFGIGGFRELHQVRHLLSCFQLSSLIVRLRVCVLE